MTDKITAYHFLRADMTAGKGSEPPWTVGETRTLEGASIPCEYGYHGSPTPYERGQRIMADERPFLMGFRVIDENPGHHPFVPSPVAGDWVKQDYLTSPVTVVYTSGDDGWVELPVSLEAQLARRVPPPVDEMPPAAPQVESESRCAHCEELKDCLFVYPDGVRCEHPRSHHRQHVLHTYTPVEDAPPPESAVCETCGESADHDNHAESQNCVGHRNHVPQLVCHPFRAPEPRTSPEWVRLNSDLAGFAQWQKGDDRLSRSAISLDLEVAVSRAAEERTRRVSVEPLQVSKAHAERRVEEFKARAEKAEAALAAARSERKHYYEAMLRGMKALDDIGHIRSEARADLYHSISPPRAIPEGGSDE